MLCSNTLFLNNRRVRPVSDLFLETIFFSPKQKVNKLHLIFLLHLYNILFVGIPGPSRTPSPLQLELGLNGKFDIHTQYFIFYLKKTGK